MQKPPRQRDGSPLPGKRRREREATPRYSHLAISQLFRIRIKRSGSALPTPATAKFRQRVYEPTMNDAEPFDREHATGGMIPRIARSALGVRAEGPGAAGRAMSKRPHQRSCTAMKCARAMLCLGLLSGLAAISACKGPPPLPGTPGIPGIPGMPGLPGLPSSLPGLPSPTSRPSLPSPGGIPSVIPSTGSGPPSDGGGSPGGDRRPKGDQPKGEGGSTQGGSTQGGSRRVWRRWLGVEQRDPGIVRDSPGRRSGTARIRGIGWRQRTREGAGGFRRPDPERTGGDSRAQKRNRGPAAAARTAQERIERQSPRRGRIRWRTIRAGAKAAA